MADETIRNLRTAEPSHLMETALDALRNSSETLIAHMDSGIAPHPALGYPDGIRLSDEALHRPENLIVRSDANTFDPERTPFPISPLTRSNQFAADLIEYPDHGVKTLSIILSNTAELNGAASPSTDRNHPVKAPGIKVVPYRVANGPLFRDRADPEPHGPHFDPRFWTRPLGRAIDNAVDIGSAMRVISISMGNPKSLGLFDSIFRVADFKAGIDRVSERAVDRAYRAGIIIVCAAGQIIDSVIQPAFLAQTIAVGGFDKNGQNWKHYPYNPFRNMDAVDVWAQAERINRAAYAGEGDLAIPTYAADGSDSESDPSGTSYAAPQVAVAAAVWVHKHRSILEEKFGQPQDRWKIVESFRAALDVSSDKVNGVHSGDGEVTLWALNIDRLLRTEPREPFAPHQESGAGWVQKRPRTKK